MDQQEAVRDLTLMLMFLTSWAERAGKLRRFWKGYDFDVLDDLDNEGLISSTRGAKSAYLTEEGAERASQLLRRYGIPPEGALTSLHRSSKALVLQGPCSASKGELHRNAAACSKG